MSYEVLHNGDEAVKMLARSLCVRSDHSADHRFELIRATLASLATVGGRAHVNSILSAALPSWSVLSGHDKPSDEDLRRRLRSALSMLQETGELVELKGGYWTAAPARLIELPGRGYLLICAAPSAFLSQDGESISHHGPYRYIQQPSSELQAALPVESLADWSRIPANTTLAAWSASLIDLIELSAYSPSEVDNFDFYSPDRAHQGAPQFKRWFQDAGDLTGKTLARRSRIYGAREFRLVETAKGRIVRAAPIPGIDVRRLMYALDLSAANPVRGRHIQNGGESIWVLSSEIPRGEQRLFAAFGTLTIPTDRPYERHWTFARNEDMAITMLRSLGIAVPR